MNEKRAIPVISMPIPLLLVPFFLSMSILLLSAISILTLLPSLPMPPMSNHNARAGRLSRDATFLDQAFALGVIGSYLMLGIHRCVSLSRF